MAVVMDSKINLLTTRSLLRSSYQGNELILINIQYRYFNNKFSRLIIDETINLGRAKLPESNSFHAAISYEEVRRTNNSTHLPHQFPVIALDDVSGGSNDKHQMRTTTLAMCIPGEVHLNLAQSTQISSMQGLTQVPYHRGGKKNQSYKIKNQSFLNCNYKKFSYP
jgi:hypothetical protein